MWFEDAIIKILTEYRHAFAMAGTHGPVDFFHPDLGGRDERAIGLDAGTYHIAKHALHVGIGEVGDVGFAIILKRKTVFFGVKTTTHDDLPRHRS